MTTLEKVLRGVCLAGVFALPFICLVVSYSMFFPYITGKNFAFRIIVELIAASWLALALLFPKYRPRRSWILGAFAIFVVIIAIADAFGAVPFKSFWSNFERMDGWVTLVHVFAYLVVIVSMLNTEKLWKTLFYVSLGVSAFVALYGFLQIAGDVALGQGGTGGFSARIDARFGNPIYMAVYMLFHIFIAALLWSRAWQERRQGRRLVLSLLFGSVIVLDTVALLFTGTRGATLGLIGGTGLAMLIYFFAPQATRKFRQITAAAFILIILSAGGLWLARETPFVKSVGFLDRLASISLSDNTTKARFLNMSMAWQGVKERPILGWGQENYAIVFDKYYDPRMYGQETWFDRVHNIIFDWWVAGGTLGLLAYLSIFGATLLVLWRGGFKDETAFSNAEKALFTGLLAGYFAHNFTVFDNITSYILFATIVGYIAWRAGEMRGSRRLTESTFISEKSLPLVAATAALLAWALLWWVNATAFAQNRALIEAIRFQDSGAQTNLEYFKKAISYDSYGTQEAREQLAQVTAQVAVTSGIDIGLKQQFFDFTVQQLKLQEEASPLDARFPLFLGLTFFGFGDYVDATAPLERAHELSSRKQTILFSIAQNQQQLGDIEGAIATLKEAFELDPDILEARIMYATALILDGDDALADEVLAPIISTGEAATQRIATAYGNRNRFDKIVKIWDARIQAYPDDTQAYFTLAAAYYQWGKRSEAVGVMRTAEEKFPSLKSQIEKLIEDIQNGTAKVGN